MAEGAPDYTHLRQIQGKDANGNLVTVRVDPSGRIILLPYGTQTVAQTDPTRTIQGIEGETLRTILVDSSGRIIMVPYGTTTVNGTLNVDQNDKTRDIQGLDGETLRSIMVDSQGRLVMIPYGWDGSIYRKLLTDEDGRMISAIKGAADVQWGLRGWWKFIASEGTAIKDYSGYGNNGTGKSGVSDEANYIDGVTGQGLALDGSDDYINCGNDESLHLEGTWSVELWFYPLALDQARGLFEKNWYVVPSVNLAVLDTGVLALSVRVPPADTESVSTGTGVITAEQWYHIVVTYNSGAIKIYVNTVVEGSGSVTDTGAITAENFNIGYSGYSNEYLYGYIDEFRVYGRVLSADEVNWRYENTNPATGKPTRMVAVDSEGRMLVNVNDLPYKGQVLERQSSVKGEGGDYSLYSSTVPTGKVWIITSVLMHASGALCAAMDIGIYDGTDNYIQEYKYAPAAVDSLNIKGQLILKAGDRLNFAWVSLPGAGVLEWSINGYELDVA